VVPAIRADSRKVQSARAGRPATTGKSWAIKAVAIAADQAKRELAIVDKQLEALTSVRTLLERSEAPGTPHALAVVALDVVSAESERAFLTALIEQLSRFQENGK